MISRVVYTMSSWPASRMLSSCHRPVKHELQQGVALLGHCQQDRIRQSNNGHCNSFILQDAATVESELLSCGDSSVARSYRGANSMLIYMAEP